jgi:hypothetical protein
LTTHAYAICFDGARGRHDTFPVIVTHQGKAISKPPHREGGKWKMTVDGVELTRVE